MDSILIVATEETPAIVLNKSLKQISIKGRCFPEHVTKFFASTVNWIEDYCKDPNPESIVEMEISYMNSASNKMIFDIVKMFEKIQSPNTVVIKWYCEDDGETDERGEEIRDLINVPVELIYLEEEEEEDEDLY